MNDILEEDRCQLQTDAMEVCSVVSIGESIRHLLKIGHMEYPNLPERKLIDVPAISRAYRGTCRRDNMFRRHSWPARSEERRVGKECRL